MAHGRNSTVVRCRISDTLHECIKYEISTRGITMNDFIKESLRDAVLKKTNPFNRLVSTLTKKS